MAETGYYNYRDRADFPAGLLRKALQDFQRRHQRPPEKVVVCRGVADSARKILAEMGLRLDVQENGGALWGEVWLPIPEETSDATTDSHAGFPRPAPDAGRDVLDEAGPSRQWMQSLLLDVGEVPGGSQSR